MEANSTKLTERMLELTLEIIYLLTGEDNIVVKKTFGDDQNSIMVPLRSLLIPERNNELKILEVTKKIIDLLTVEIGNWDNLNICIKEEIDKEDEEDNMMKEQECLKGYRNPYKDIMIASQPALTSPDGSCNGNPPERCPLYSQDSTQEDLTIPHHHQGVEVINIKTEMKAKEEMYIRDDQPLMNRTEMMVTITKEESCLDVRTGGHNGWNTPKECLILSAHYQKDDKGKPHSPVTHNLRDKPNHMVRLPSLCYSEESKDESHTIIPNVQPSFHIAKKPPYPFNPEDSSPNNLYPFQDCEKSFILTHELVVPQRIHIVKKPFSCSECMKSFKKKSHLIEHQRIHTGEKPYLCSECKNSFANKSALVRHHKIHTGKKPFSCSECGKSFAEKSKLRIHQAVHTGEKPYLCSECKKSFVNRSDLVRHQKIHTGKKPFSCSECGKPFAEKSKLRIHQRVHTGEKPFLCPECGKSFSDKGNCDRHMKIHTGDKPFS